jgi:type IV pilus assembly protein PilO
MFRNFDPRALLKDRRALVRAGLGAMLAANLVAAVLVIHPLGGSAEDLADRMRSKQRELDQNLQHIQRTRNLVGKVQQAKVDGDEFLKQCTMNRRTAFSTLIGEVNKMAEESGMKPKESSLTLDAVTGSDTIEQLTIAASYEGSYPSLTKLVNMLDKSPRFLIIESMQATPMANGALNVTIRLDTFIREGARAKS